MTVVRQALESVDTVCDATGRNQACYGNRLIDVEFAPDMSVTFEKPGDLTDLIGIRSLHTAPLNIADDEWGIALMKVQANLPDTLPGQNVTFLMTGDVSLTDATHSGATPMQSFYFSTGVGETSCQSAPDNLVIQSPLGTRVTLNVNGVDISLGSTAVLETRRGESMDVLLVGGEGEISALDESQTVPAGLVTTIALGGDNGLTAVAPPTIPEPYDPARVQYVPFALLPESIQIPATVSWVNTGIGLHTGQSFTVSASDFVNTHIMDDDYADFNRWVTPAGLPVDDACFVHYPEVDGGINCRCSTADCTIEGAPLMALVGRVGVGNPFIIGPGGTFTASNDGNLSLAANDDRRSDNGGAFSAIVTAYDTAGAAIPANASLPCVVTATETVNLRSGPCTDYSLRGEFMSGTSATAVGQATAPNGYLWWELSSGSWVRSDIVGAIGDCQNLPVVSAP